MGKQTPVVFTKPINTELLNDSEAKTDKKVQI